MCFGADAVDAAGMTAANSKKTNLVYTRMWQRLFLYLKCAGGLSPVQYCETQQEGILGHLSTTLGHFHTFINNLFVLRFI